MAAGTVAAVERNVNVGVLGCGNVGAALISLIGERADVLEVTDDDPGSETRQTLGLGRISREDDDLVAALEQSPGDQIADEPGTAGDQMLHACCFLASLGPGSAGRSSVDDHVLPQEAAKSGSALLAAGAASAHLIARHARRQETGA